MTGDLRFMQPYNSILWRELGAISKILLRFLFLALMSRDSSLVTRRTRLWLDDPGFDSRRKQGNISLPKHPYKLLAPRNLSENGCCGFSAGGNAAGGQSAHSPPFNAESKSGWSCTFTPYTHLHDVDRNKLTLACYSLPTSE